MAPARVPEFLGKACLAEKRQAWAAVSTGERLFLAQTGCFYCWGGEVQLVLSGPDPGSAITCWLGPLPSQVAFTGLMQPSLQTRFRLPSGFIFKASCLNFLLHGVCCAMGFLSPPELSCVLGLSREARGAGQCVVRAGARCVWGGGPPEIAALDWCLQSSWAHLAAPSLLLCISPKL